MKMYEGVGDLAPPFLTSALNGSEWLASRSRYFTPGKIDPDAHFVGGWLGPKTGLNAVE
jgi:hypothetical protein